MTPWELRLQFIQPRPDVTRSQNAWSRNAQQAGGLIRRAGDGVLERRQLLQQILELAVVALPSFGCSRAHARPVDRAQDPPGQMMGGMHQEIDKQRQMQDEELGKLVDQMNSAPAEQKLGATVAVINKLVQQRKEMYRQLQSVQQPATNQSRETGMQCCRMMQPAAKNSDQTTNEHSEQHR
jgi:hypothetical protein